MWWDLDTLDAGIPSFYIELDLRIRFGVSIAALAWEFLGRDGNEDMIETRQHDDYVIIDPFFV